MVNFMKKTFPFFAVFFAITSAFAFTACQADRQPSAPTNLECTARDSAADCLFFTPTLEGEGDIVDYIVRYKTASETSYTVFADGISTDTAFSFTGLTNGIPYNAYVTARNAYGDSVASNTVTFTPAGAGGAVAGLDEVLTGVVAFHNGNNYAGSGAFLNEAATPADGSAQSAYDLTASGSIFDSASNCFIFDASNTLSLSSNPAFINALANTSSGNDWSMMALVESGSPTAQMTILGTADVAADHGLVWRSDTGGSHKVDQYNGVAAVTQNGTNNLAINTRYTLAVKYDADTNTIGFARNSDTFVTKTAAWTASTSAATYTLKVGSEGNGGSKTAGWKLCGLAIIDHDLTDAELALANDWFDSAFPTDPPSIPDAPYSLVAMPSNTKAFLAWDITSEGGSAITDYVIQRDCGSGYSTFADGTSTNKFATVTGLTNGTSCNFKVAAVNALGTSAYSEPKAATPAPEGTNPYNETLFKITLPVNSSGNRTGSAQEILAASIGTYESAWFGRFDSKFQFNCVYPAATTATATYGRSEMRGLTGGQQFNFNDDSDDTLKFSVDNCPTSSGNTKVVVQQIHDADEPIYKLNYDCKATAGTDTLRALIKVGDGDAFDCDFDQDGVKGPADVCPTIWTGARGTQIKSRVVYDGDGSDNGGQQTLKFYVNDNLEESIPIYRAGLNDPMYTKRGNYCQLGPAGSVTTVTHYAP